MPTSPKLAIPIRDLSIKAAGSRASTTSTWRKTPLVAAPVVTAKTHPPRSPPTRVAAFVLLGGFDATSDVSAPALATRFRLVPLRFGQFRPPCPRPIIPHSQGPRGESLLMIDVTQILNAIEKGDPQAAEQLLPLVYEELRKLAAQRMAQEKPGHPLEATAWCHAPIACAQVVSQRRVSISSCRRWVRPKRLPPCLIHVRSAFRMGAIDGKDARTTMIDTHLLNPGSRGVRSPADGLARRAGER
jgi:hypothetical protein